MPVPNSAMARSLAGVAFAMALAGYGWLGPAVPSEGKSARGKGLAIAQEVPAAVGSDGNPPPEAVARGVWGLRWSGVFPLGPGASAKEVGTAPVAGDEADDASTEEEDAEQEERRQQAESTARSTVVICSSMRAVLVAVSRRATVKK